MQKRNKLAMVTAVALAMTGCGGGGGSSSADGGASGGGGNTETVSVSGRAADGYLVQANVCADLNANGQCDAGEPNTTTGAGGLFSLDIPADQLRTEIVVEAIPNLTVDEDNGQPVPKGFTLRSPILGDGQDQFVSPISTMVADEMRKNGDTSAVRAKQTVQQRLGTSFDLTSDYVAAAADNSDSTAQQNAERLHRIAQVTTRVMADIESNVTQSELDQAGITKADFLALAQQQIQLLIPFIVDDVNDTIAEDTFDPDSIASAPEYEVDTPIDDQPPTTGGDPSAPSETLTDRVAGAVSASPFFTNGPNGLTPILDASASHIEFAESPVDAGKFYFLELERTLVSGLGSSGTDEQLEYASNDINGAIEPELIEADTAEVKVWNTIKWDQGPINESFAKGMLVAAPTSNSNGVFVNQYVDAPIVVDSSYMEVDLAQLDSRITISSLFRGIAPTSLMDIQDQSLFPDEAKAYILDESFKGDVFMTSWRGLREGAQNDSCSLNAPISVVKSCNVVYGNEDGGRGSAMPSTTLDNHLYPPSASVLNLSPDGPQISGGIGFESGGDDYMMYLFGSLADGTGRIEVVNSVSDDNLTDYFAEGTWSRVAEPFEHIRIDLPDGLYFRAFLDTVGGDGYAYLHEHEGYVRAGRFTPAGVSLDTYYGRSSDTMMLNEAAVDHVMSKLGEWDKLAAHPAFSDPTFD